jgi:hypothetical protein
VLANSTTQFEYNRGRSTKSFIRAAADARELYTRCPWRREIRQATTISACDTHGERNTSPFANTTGGKHA